MNIARIVIAGLLTLPCFAADLRGEDLRIPAAVIKIVESVDVPAERAGVIQMIGAKEGRIVKMGDVLATISDQTAQLKLQRAQLEHEIAQRLSKDDTLIQYAEKSLDVVTAELHRSERANKSVALAVSDSEIDHLRLVVSKTELEVKKANIEFDVATLTEKLRRIEIEESQSELEKHQIRSPIDGMVVRVDKQVGEWIDIGDPVFRIVRIDRLRVEGFVDVKDATRGLETRPVEISVKQSDGTVIKSTGKVVFVSPEANPVDSRVRVWAEVDNTKRELRPGLRTEMIIQIDDVEETEPQLEPSGSKIDS